MRMHARVCVAGPIERGGVVVQSWQRVPSTLLQEHCQREKRPRPSYRCVWVGVYFPICSAIVGGRLTVCVCACVTVCVT